MGRRWPCWVKLRKRAMEEKGSLSLFLFPQAQYSLQTQELPSGCGCPASKAARLAWVAEGLQQPGDSPALAPQVQEPSGSHS